MDGMILLLARVLSITVLEDVAILSYLLKRLDMPDAKSLVCQKGNRNESPFKSVGRRCGTIIVI